VTDLSWCASEMAEHVVVGSRPRYSCARVRTPAQRWRCSQHVRGNGEAVALVFRRLGMSAAGGWGFGAIVFRELPSKRVHPTFFCSADRVPSRAGRTDTRTCEARGAEAPRQRTARGRLLQRVRPREFKE
jgi:hypothetical protein